MKPHLRFDRVSCRRGGRLLFEDDQVSRVRWQADTRRVWLDERPALRARQQAWLKAVGNGR